MADSKDGAKKTDRTAAASDSAAAGPGFGLWLALGILFAGAFVLLPSTMIVVAGMVPTLVAALIDRSRTRLVPVTVGVLNLAGILPFILELWEIGHTVDNATLILARPMTFLVMYLAAAAGWLVHLFVPPVIASVIATALAGRQSSLEEKQLDLIRDWGKDVAGKLPLPPGVEKEGKATAKGSKPAAADGPS